MQDSFFITSQKKPINFIASHSCITQVIQSKNHFTADELLASAYKNHRLDLKQSYLSYSFFQALTQEHYSFFTPKIHPTSALLDLLLPIHLMPQMCCIFLSKNKNYFCFYQDHALVFYKEFQGDIKTCLQHIKLLFDYEVLEVYCLCYPDTDASLSTLQQSYNLLPLLSLFSPHLGFELSSIHSPIVLETFYDLNPQNHAIPFKNLKMLTGIAGLALILLSAMASALSLYQSKLLDSFEALNQNISSASFNSPIEEIRYFNAENQKYLASLLHFSALNTQKLTTLSHILPSIPQNEILSIHFNAPHTFSILFQEHLNVTSLIATLNHLGYRCKSLKDQNGISLEISKI